MSATGSIVIMGVSGAGKTTVARALSRAVGRDFIDADDHHPPENVAKMRAGQPLDDADRAPWLDRLARLLAARHRQGRPVILACSALKQAYRDVLARPAPLCIVHLAIDRATVAARAARRRGHFFDPSLIDSQFAALEPPENAVEVDATRPVDELVETLCRRLDLARVPGD
ncbi:MAG: gluconokinase [Planctomycetota bacterium]